MGERDAGLAGTQPREIEDPRPTRVHARDARRPRRKGRAWDGAGAREQCPALADFLEHGQPAFGEPLLDQRGFRAIESNQQKTGHERIVLKARPAKKGEAARGGSVSLISGSF